MYLSATAIRSHLCASQRSSIREVFGSVEICLELTELHSVQDVSTAWILGTRLGAWKWPLSKPLAMRWVITPRFRLLANLGRSSISFFRMPGDEVGPR